MKAYHWRPLLEEREGKKREAPPAVKPAAEVSMPSGKIKGPPICIECAFHRNTYDWIRGKATHWCYHPESRHPVTGVATDPSVNRRDKLDCGPWRNDARGRVRHFLGHSREGRQKDREPAFHGVSRM